MKNYVTLIMAMTVALVFGQNSPGLYTVKNAKINTQSSDFGTAFFGKDKVVFAAPKQGFTFNREEYNSQPFLDLYIGEVTEDGQIIKKQKLPGDINSKYHEGMVSFTKDMKTVYFSANNYVKKKKKKEKVKSTSYIQLFMANVTEEGEWTNLKLLPFNGNNFSTGHPVLNKDDSQLYFVSDRHESYGKTDLFVVDIHPDGSFSKPRNLGPQINTAEREMFPFIGSDNVLYFSSDGYPGYGELDVYASKIFDTTVSEPINLEEPVNSEHDDFAYIIDDHKNRGYFSSNRAGGHGDDDIYSFVASPPIYIECQQEIRGVARDIDTQELVPDVLIVLFDAQGKELQSFVSSIDDGSFSFEQSCNTSYTLKGYLEGHLVGELDIKTVNDLDAAPLEITLILTKTVNDQEEVVAHLDSQTSPNQEAAGTEAALASNSFESKESEVSSSQMKDAAGDDGKKKVMISDTKISSENMNQDADAVAFNAMTDASVNSSGSDAVAVAGIAVVSSSSNEADYSTTKINDEKDIQKDAEPGSYNVVQVDHKTDQIQQKSIKDDGMVADSEAGTVSQIAMDTSEEGNGSMDQRDGLQQGTLEKEVIHINTIYFDYDKYDIRFDAKIELEKIAVVLKQNPQTKLKVNAHTDIRGKQAYNLKLSNSRAKHTVQYLIDQGIEVDRISGEGHGENQVAEKCTKQDPCNSLRHQLNRRSEFLIVDNISDVIIAKSTNKVRSGNYATSDKVPNSGLYVNYDFSDDREVFTVQIGAFKGKVQNDIYSKLTDLFNYRYDDGLNRYYAGIFESSSDAKIYLEKIKNKGFKDAFVVGLKGTNRF